MKHLLWIPLLCLLAGACSNSGEWSSFRSPEAAGWAYAHPLVFDSVPAGKSGTLVLSVRHAASYPFSNLWVELSASRADSVLWRDTLDVCLADALGSWRGRGSGASLQVSDTLARAFTPDSASVLSVRHIMRPDTVEGIERIGITFISD